MRPQLLGYLLDALEPAEREALEDEVSHNPALAAELEAMRDTLDPLMDDDEPIAVPAGLAQRTCHFVAARCQIERDTGSSTGSSQWNMQDIGIAAGIFVAASMLFFPAVLSSRNSARRAHCVDNLRVLGSALDQFTSALGQLPSIEAQGNLATAGVYAPRLFDAGFLEQPNVLVCPSSPLAKNIASFHFISLDEVRRATGKKLNMLQSKMGGSYAYPLGYIVNGKYHPPSTEHRENFPLMADAPGESGSFSEHHGRSGQNVLFEDWHVQFRKSSTYPSANGQQDDIFVNDAGDRAAGLHPDDAVLGDSDTPPLPAVVETEAVETEVDEQ
jgi:hypothetical protein